MNRNRLTANNDKATAELKARLRESTELPDWDRLREKLVERASADGLVDISYEIHESPFGPLVVGATAAGIVRIGLSAESEEEVIEGLAKRVSARILKAGRPEITSAREQLDQYFEGERKRFKLKLDWQLTQGFRHEVLAATNRIPYGETSSYRAVATRAGSPKAVRAAGSALANNPLPILVPCHRVLRSDGQVGSYLGGSSMKESLLRMESGSPSV